MPFTTKTNTRVYQKSGKFGLFIPKPDGTLETGAENRYLSNKCAVEKIQTTMSFQSSDLPDGNSNWPAGSFVTGTTGTAVITMSSFDEKLYAFLSGATFKSAATNVDFWEISYETVVGSDAKVILPGTKTVGTVASLVVCDGISGEEYTAAGEIAPATMEYDFDDATMTLTFNNDAKGKGIFVTYLRSAASATKVEQSSVANIPSLHLIVSGENTDISGSDLRVDNYVIDVCRLSGDINPPTRQRTPEGWSFTVAIQKPRSGKLAIDWISTSQAIAE